MKTVRRTQMEVFEGVDLDELKRDFNSKMDRLARYGAKTQAPQIDLPNLRGCVLYEEEWKEPQTLRDFFDFYGERVTCGQCSEFCPTRYSWGECQYCRGDLRKADDPCERFWKMWENGDCLLDEKERKNYREIENEFRRSRIRSVPGCQAV